jgi:hypothetical protein
MGNYPSNLDNVQIGALKSVHCSDKGVVAVFEKLRHFMYRRRKLAVILFVIGILAAGGIGSSVFNRLDSGGYSNPKSDSYKVYNYIHDTLKIADPDDCCRC